MPTETFQASRWTRGNRLFPTIIEVSDKAVTRHKRSWFGHDEISVSMSKVASVHVHIGLIWRLSNRGIRCALRSQCRVLQSRHGF